MRSHLLCRASIKDVSLGASWCERLAGGIPTVPRDGRIAAAMGTAIRRLGRTGEVRRVAAVAAHLAAKGARLCETDEEHVPDCKTRERWEKINTGRWAPCALVLRAPGQRLLVTYRLSLGVIR